MNMIVNTLMLLVINLRQMESFVRWCQKQEWYENTNNVIITGDHKSMSEKFFKHLDKNYFVLLIIVLLIVH